MCEVCHITTYTSVQLERIDPTRTSVLRQTFIKDMNRRFLRLRKSIFEAIVTDDCFGIKDPAVYVSPGRNAFAFPRSADKVEAFMRWLNLQVQKELLEIQIMPQAGQAMNEAWVNVYIRDSYRRGITRARYELKKAGYNVPPMADSGGVGIALENPFHADRLGVLYTRVFNELKGITNAMDTQISRVLTDGIANGDHPREIARKLNAVIKGGGGDLGIRDSLGRFIPAERRAQTLARTEIIRAHHQATIQEYKNYEAYGVYVQAEWSTAKDDRVCELCAPMEGTVYGLDEAMSMIPFHPNCRCMMLPQEVRTKTNPDLTV